MLGALVDCGCPLGEIESGLRKLELPGWKISAQKVKRGALAATQVVVESAEDHHHRGYSLIAEKIAKANLPACVARARDLDFQTPR